MLTSASRFCGLPMSIVVDIAASSSEAKSSDDNHFLTTRQIFNYENDYLERQYKEGSYNDIRRAHLIMQTVSRCIICSSLFQEQSTNTPTHGYACSPIFAELLRSYGTKKWDGLAYIRLKGNIVYRESDIEKVLVKYYIRAI